MDEFFHMLESMNVVLSDEDKGVITAIFADLTNPTNPVKVVLTVKAICQVLVNYKFDQYTLPVIKDMANTEIDELTTRANTRNHLGSMGVSGKASMEEAVVAYLATLILPDPNEGELFS